MNAAEFSVIGIKPSSEQIPIPLGARIRAFLPGYQKNRRDDDMDAGTLEIVAQRREKAPIRCLARYQDGYVAVIVLKCDPTNQNDAIALEKALSTAYPLERIRIEKETRKHHK